MPQRRIPRTQTRGEHYTGLLTASATTGSRALKASSDWLLSELSAVSEHDPERADAIRWDFARQGALYAARIPRLRLTRGGGLTSGELEQMLHPFGKAPRGGGSR